MRQRALEKAIRPPSPAEPDRVIALLIDAIAQANAEKLRAVIHQDADLGSLVAGRRLSGREDVVQTFLEKHRHGLLRIRLLSVENVTPTVGLAHESVRRPLDPKGHAEETVYYLFEIQDDQVRRADYFFDRETALETFRVEWGGNA